jgi:hypothetical protein
MWEKATSWFEVQVSGRRVVLGENIEVNTFCRRGQDGAVLVCR